MIAELSGIILTTWGWVDYKHTLRKKAVPGKAVPRKAVQVKVVGHGSRRRALYQSHPDLIYVISKVLMSREKKLLEQIKEKQIELNALICSSKENLYICPEKMDELDDMVSSAQEMLGCLVSSGLISVNK